MDATKDNVNRRDDSDRFLPVHTRGGAIPKKITSRAIWGRLGIHLDSGAPSGWTYQGYGVLSPAAARRKSGYGSVTAPTPVPFFLADVEGRTTRELDALRRTCHHFWSWFCTFNRFRPLGAKYDPGAYSVSPSQYSYDRAEFNSKRPIYPADRIFAVTLRLDDRGWAQFDVHWEDRPGDLRRIWGPVLAIGKTTSYE